MFPFQNVCLVVWFITSSVDAFIIGRRPSVLMVPIGKSAPNFNALVVVSDISMQSSTSLNLFRRVYRAIRGATVGGPRQEISEGQVRSLFYEYNELLATGNSKLVAQRYSKNHPVLLPTISDEPRLDYRSIKAYFDTFLTLKPQGTIKLGKIQIGHNHATDAGVYEFTMGATGEKVKARYSFVYVYENGQWKILLHHSSTMPEEDKKELLPKKMSSDEDVRALFSKWNNAMATLDSTIVAKRFAQNAVLFPIKSDVPRTDFASIKDYYDTFLLLRPQCEILESIVTIYDIWCSDVGIYEFTMGATGEKVRARYTFVYHHEENKWKIGHHHASVMPEERSNVKNIRITEIQVKGLLNLWNDAISTCDSETVASLYSKDAILIPSISDMPRTDYKSIKEYFDLFLLRKPQGKVIDSSVTIGDGWCKDTGLYEFILEDGMRVRGRYAFIYIYEDNSWKILHHHSMLRPEHVLGHLSDVPSTTNEEEVSSNMLTEEEEEEVPTNTLS